MGTQKVTVMLQKRTNFEYRCGNPRGTCTYVSGVVRVKGLNLVSMKDSVRIALDLVTGGLFILALSLILLTFDVKIWYYILSLGATFISLGSLILFNYKRKHKKKSEKAGRPKLH